MERDELAAWLRLTLTPGVGNETARALLTAFGLPEDIFRQSTQALELVVGRRQAAALGREPDAFAAQLDKTWRWLQGDDGPSEAADEPGAKVLRRVVPMGDPIYPVALLQTEDPPVLLYMMGAIDAHGRAHLQAPRPSGAETPDPAEDAIHAVAQLRRAIAIVGSRNPTPQGTANARQFGRAFAAADITVVSGLALGIDAAAHEGALEGAAEGGKGLPTIAVVGTGLDRVYPRQHRSLAHRIASRGLLVSEYPLGTPPLAPNFPKRNRIIAALSRGTLVVEAALASGSLITARQALEQGKEVFAIPGSIHAPQSRGCHALIKQGAKLVETAQDVLEELSMPDARSAPAEVAASMSPADDAAFVPQAPLLGHLGYDPVSLDALVARTGLDAAALQAQLLELELDGHVARLPGGLVQRTAHT